MKPKVLSLFDGSGCWQLAAELVGFEAKYASEIEEFPIKVTSKNFPNMIHLGDVTKIKGNEIEPCEIITAGSPCQDLSVAFNGKRAGLKGERSGLFMEVIRIVKEMRGATNGRYPKIVFWENVCGSFSSNAGEDYRAVIEEFVHICDPNAYIPRPSQGKWANSGLVGADGFSLAWRVLNAQYWGVPQRRRRVFLTFCPTDECAGKILFERSGLRRDFKKVCKERKGIAGVAEESTRSAIKEKALCIGNGQAHDAFEPEEVCKTLNCMVDPMKIVTVPADEVLMCMENVGSYKQGSVASTLKRRDYKSATDLIIKDYSVRRLTPTEYARLQGFPDDWCEGIPHSDAAEYKLWGNGMALPCALYLMEGAEDYFNVLEKQKEQTRA